MKNFKIVFIGISIFWFNGLFAQTGLNSFSFSMVYIATGEVQQSGINNGGQQMVDSVYKRVCIVDLPASLAVSKIHISVGSHKDASDVFSHAYIYNDSLNLTYPLSYHSTGNRIYLGLFNTISTDMYYYKVWLEDPLGTMYEPRYFY